MERPPLWRPGIPALVRPISPPRRSCLIPMSKQEKTFDGPIGRSGSTQSRLAAGETAVVTGATGALGVHLAESLIRAGANLVAVHRRPAAASAERLSHLASCAETRGVRFEAVQADLADLTSIPPVFEASARMNGCTILVNAASIFIRGPILELSDERLHELTMTNLAAPGACCREAIRQMRTRGRGTIVNIIDVGGGVIPWKNGAAYCASRAGLAMLTQCLALELAPMIRVNALAVGLTELSPEAGQPDAPALTNIPAGRAGKTREIVHAFMGLIDPAAALTGQILAADGGRSLRRTM